MRYEPPPRREPPASRGRREQQHYPYTRSPEARSPEARSSTPTTPYDRRSDDPSHRRTQRTLRTTGSLGVILVAVVSVVVLGACLSGLAMGVARQFTAPSAPTESAPAIAASPTATQPAAPPTTAPTAAPQANPDWRALRELDFGFQLDIPGVLSSSHGFYINGTSGQGLDLTYQGAPLGDALQQLEAETRVEVLFSSAITDTNICPGNGTLVTVGSGIPGRQRTNVPPTPNGPPAPYPYVDVSFVLHGVAIQLQLSASQAAPETFLTRYGALWQHMLASVAAVPGGPGDSNHPCG